MLKQFDRRHFLKRAAAATGALAAGAGPSSHAGAAGSWGDLTGRFVYDGAPPAREKLAVTTDIECCGKFDIRDESLLVGEQGGLRNVYVYVRSRVAAICPELQENIDPRVVLDNRDCIFIPHCMSIWYPRQEYHIVNSDPVAQNVAFTPFLDNRASLVIAVDGNATWQFRKPQRAPVPIACNYHPWESAYVLPLDHPYVAISGADGSFKIPRLPAGMLELQFWHERPGFLDTYDWPDGRLAMEIKPGMNDLGTVRLPPSTFAK